jgi:hypothetical protein
MESSVPGPTPASSFVWLTPLTGWPALEQAIAPGMAIRRLDCSEKAAVESAQALLDHHDIPPAAVADSWLCYEFLNHHPTDNVRYRRRQEAAFKLLLHAMYAIQILAPVGAANLFLLYRRTDGVPILDSTLHRPPFLHTIWAGMCDVPPSFEGEIGTLLERIHDAFQKPTLRLQIPVWLFEQGLIAPDRHIRILLWATGLDGITRSGGTVAFGERLCTLLGPDEEIFPPRGTERRPGYKVADVVGDLYQLRNEMAHGLPFHEKFRKTRGFLADDELPVFAACAEYRYDQVLEECAVFLLCKALREVFLRNRVFDVHTLCWSEQA